MSEINRKSMLNMVKSSYIQSFIKKYKFSYFIGIIVLIVIDYLQTKVPIIIRNIIDGYKLRTININNIHPYLINLAVFALIIGIGKLTWRLLIFGTARKIERDIRNDMFEHLEKLSPVYYNHHKTGEIMAYITNDLEAVRMAMGMGLMMFFDVIALCIFTLYSMSAAINFTLTVVTVIPLLLITATTLIVGPKMFKRFSKRQESFAKVSDFVQENLSGIKVIKAFVQQEQEISEFKKVSKDYLKKNIHLVKLDALIRPLMMGISGLSFAIAIVFGSMLAIKRIITIGEFVAFFEYISILVWPMIAIGMTINMITRGSAALERIEKVLKEKIDIKDSEEVKLIDTYDGNIKVNNLNFKYPEADEYVLKNISFEIKKGQTLGIVGRTGSGKTTLVNLLLRLYNIEKGMINIDGYDINDIPLVSLRTNIGYVPQENFLFSDTIKNNIDFSDGNLEFDEITKATDFSCVHENILDFKDSYDTVVGERGVTLSGGQKQRVSISRAYIKNPEILILDDSVSAVDTNTEEKILKNLKEERANKTNIIIAHRISTIKHSDLIIVIDDGKIIEQGTHDMLIEKDGLYNSLYQKQLLEEMIDEEV